MTRHVLAISITHPMQATRDGDGEKAFLAHGEMGKLFPMCIARLPHVHLLDHCYYLKASPMSSPMRFLGPALPGRHPGLWCISGITPSSL